ncbi:hypothetical protein [Candidatus Pantoea soli]|uniref:hypothetical protein n=1 Tax=Candidatus Pantoea soli TaxID=3098669 RepID=UPI0016459A45|nr:hypothetical protein [Pantoea soli]
MSYHDDDKHNVIIGEAAFHLAVAGEAISVESLIGELNQMAEDALSDARTEEISEVSQWLKTFRRPGMVGNKADLHLVMMASPDDESKHN